MDKSQLEAISAKHLAYRCDGLPVFLYTRDKQVTENGVVID